MKIEDIDKKDKVKLLGLGVAVVVVTIIATTLFIWCTGCMRYLPEGCRGGCVWNDTLSDEERFDGDDKDIVNASDNEENDVSESNKENEVVSDDSDTGITGTEESTDEGEDTGEEKTTANSVEQSDDKNNTDDNNEETTTVKKEETNKPVQNVTKPNKIKKLHVSGANLVDESGKTVQLKGISTHGLAWFPKYVNNNCFKQLHDEMGVQLVRLAMYSAENNGYCTGGDKTELKKLVKNGVKYATDNDMYVIIDWHVHGEQNPHIHKEEAKKFFAEMAKEYADYDNVFYEICNEPSGGTSWSQIKSYALEVIKVIRKYDDDGIIIVGTPNWCQYVTDAAKDPIKDYDNIMYSLHFYAGTHMDSLRNEMVSAIKMGLPIFVTEYGICDASGNGGINISQANKWMALLDKYGISSAMWNLSNKNESAAAIKPSCNKYSGFKESDLSQAGKWLADMLKGKVTGTTDGGDDSGSAGDSGTSNSGNSNSAGSSGSVNNTGDSGSSGNVQETTTAAYKITATATAEVTNSWGSGEEYFYQLNITIKNTGSKKCTEWVADIVFDGNIKVSSGWCGKFSVNGSTLHIEPENYNGVIEAGGQVTGIGIIISSDKELDI